MIELAVVAVALALVAGLWWRKPPEVHINVNLDVELARLIPATLRLQMQAIPPDAPPGGDEPLPVELYDYIHQESEPTIADQRERYARGLKQKLGTWDEVMRQLQREDNG